jgi:catechol 2,3-dioxygenase-like lactoylglutathione lyase family enzyme
MIIGLDHVAVSVHPLSTVLPQWLATGQWSLGFERYDVPNAPEKKPLLSHYQSAHHLAMVHPVGGGGLPVELTDHGPVDTRQAFSASAPADVHAGLELSGNTLIIAHTAGELIEPVFWQQWLKLKPSHDANHEETSIGHYQFNSLVAGYAFGMQFVPQPQADYRSVYLDSPGVVCLAFIGTHWAKDAHALTTAGAHVASQRFTLDQQGEQGNKILDIGFFRSPSGVLIELICPQLSQQQSA